jgi:hypothetical protein
MLIGISLLNLSACSSGGPDAKACGLIQEGYQNIKPLLANDYWVYDDASRFQAARNDYGTTSEFLGNFSLPKADFDAAAESESLSKEDKAVITKLTESINDLYAFYGSQVKASQKSIEIQLNLTNVLALCSK